MLDNKPDVITRLTISAKTIARHYSRSTAIKAFLSKTAFS